MIRALGGEGSSALRDLISPLRINFAEQITCTLFIGAEQHLRIRNDGTQSFEKTA